MRPLSRRDILGPKLYAPVRDDLRREIIARKAARRLILGDRASLVFENRDTLRLQIEEMCRTENLTTDDKIQEEIDVYNTMLPSPTELSATLFLEIPRDEDPRQALGRLIGLDEHLILHAGEHRARARFEEGRQTEDRISAVQYVRFALTPEQREAVRTPGTKLAMEIDHPNYRVRVEMSEETRASIARDLDED